MLFRLFASLILLHEAVLAMATAESELRFVQLKYYFITNPGA